MSLAETPPKFQRHLLNKLFSTILFLSIPVIPWFYALTKPVHQIAAEFIIFNLFFLACLLLPRSTFSCIPPFHPLDNCFLLALLLCLIYVPLSVLPFPSLVLTCKFFSVLVLYFLSQQLLSSKEHVFILFWVFLLAGFFYSVYGLLQWYGYLDRNHWYGPESLAAKYINGSHFANFLYLSLFSAITLMLTTKRKLLMLLIGLIIPVLLLAFIYARSRTAYIGFFLGLIFYFIYSGVWKILRAQKTSWTISLLIIPVILVLLFKGAAVALDRIWEIWDGTNPPFYSLIQRAGIMRDSLRAIAARPWGWGTGMFVEIMPQFRIHQDGFLLNYAHNEFIQFGVDFGIPGILFLLLFIKSYFQTALRSFKKENLDFSKRCIYSCFLSVAVAVIFNSMADFPLRIFANSLLFSIFAGAASATFSDFSINTSQRTRSFPRFIVVGTVFVAILFSGARLYAQIRFEQAEYYKKYFKWDRAEEEYAKALAILPKDYRISGAYAGLLKMRMHVSRFPEKHKSYRERAIRLYEQTVQNAVFFGYHYDLARLYEEENRISEAEDQMRKALQRAPQDGFIVSEFGYFALKYLQPDVAVASFEKCQAMPFKGNGKCQCWEIMEAAVPKISRYEDLKRISGSLAEDHRCLGEALGRIGQWDLAKKELDIALSMALVRDGYDRFSIYTRNPILEFYLANDRIVEALEIYRKSLEIQPGDTALREKIQQLETRTGVD